MPSLTPSLKRECRKLLEGCGYFDNYGMLIAFFKNSKILEPFWDVLKQGNSFRELFELNLQILLNTIDINKQPILLVFLQELWHEYEPGQSLYQEIPQLINEINSFLTIPERKSSQLSEKHIYQRLFSFILGLNFNKQIDAAKGILADQKVAALLIQGSPRHGQHVLVNRLYREILGESSGQRIVIDVTADGIGKDISAFREVFISKLKLNNNSSNIDVVEKVYQWWQTQHVVFVLQKVDYMPSEFLQEFLEEFWSPIINRARQDPNFFGKENCLLMLLVDYAGSVSKNNLEIYSDFSQPNFDRLICLPYVEKFQLKTLEDWIRLATYAEIIPEGFLIADLLDDSSEIVPQVFYEKVCNHCGLSWEGEVAKCLV